MKIGVLILTLIVLFAVPGKAAVEENDKDVVVNDATPIVVNDEGNETAAQNNATSQATPPSDVPSIVQEENKEHTFTLDDQYEFEGNYGKAGSDNKTADPSISPSPQLALQTQRQAQIEEEKHKEELEDEQSRLRPWVVQQMQSSEQQVDGIVTESFQFILDSEGEYNFRWNPPKTQMLSIHVLVFQILNNGEIMLQHDMEENEFIEIATREEGHTVFNPLGHVYIAKIFRINFDTDFKYFQFTSHMPKSVFVVVDLQKTHEVIPTESVARDHHFQIPLEKLKAIEDEVESGQKIRQHTYKYEWGFLDNQYAHDSKLLGLTGFELIVIISAAITQLYFIKSLLDNRAVV